MREQGKRERKGQREEHREREKEEPNQGLAPPPTSSPLRILLKTGFHIDVFT